MTRRRSRAGATGGSWYGSYDIVATDPSGAVVSRSSATSKRFALKRARELSREHGYADVRTDEWTGSVLVDVFRDGKRLR